MRTIEGQKEETISYIYIYANVFFEHLFPLLLLHVISL